MTMTTHDASGWTGPQFLVVTTNDLPGYRIDQVFGEVFGLTVRSATPSARWARA